MPSTMDPEMTILPKGIVINTKKIYEEIAGYDVVPKNRLWEIWRVYTTTTKELQDPTARRLENFWWHVLGSDRQYLKGPSLARMFEDISLGPTAVPLKGPPNRWDGDVPPHIIQQAMAILEAEQQHPHQSETALDQTRRIRDLSSSAAKPPPSHPILKKPRGPSASGPRPTARFVSPQPSEDEGNSAASSASTITPGLEMRQPVASPSKKKAHGKKFVASSGAAKRRPVLPRKNSSNSSVLSSEGPSSGSSRGSGTPVRTPTAIAEEKVDLPSIGSDDPVKPSAKALGKRPVEAKRTIAEQKPPNKAAESTSDRPDNAIETTTDLSKGPRSPKISGTQAASSPLRPQLQPQQAPPEPPAPATAHKRAPRPPSLGNIPNTSFSHSRSPSLYSARSTATSDTSVTSPSISSPPLTSVPMAQSRSHSGFIRPRDRHSHSGSLNRSLYTGATTASTTDVAAQGTIIDQSGSVDSTPIPTFYSTQATETQRNSSSSSLLDLQFRPTPPGPSGSVPLGRTKSQLTLVLEKDQVRAGKKPRSKS